MKKMYLFSYPECLQKLAGYTLPVLFLYIDVYVSYAYPVSINFQ